MTTKSTKTVAKAVKVTTKATAKKVSTKKVAIVQPTTKVVAKKKLNFCPTSREPRMTQSQADAIFDMREEGFKLKDIATEFFFNISTISETCNGIYVLIPTQLEGIVTPQQKRLAEIKKAREEKAKATTKKVVVAKKTVAKAKK